jgi:hypothetical protein
MLPSNQVIEAIVKLNYQVTTADVATQTGLALQVANREVAALASMTDGHLQVSETGEIAYRFDQNFQGILLQRSAQARWQRFWRGVWGVIFYLIRISFGIVLVLSILLVVLGIIAAVVVINSNNSDDDDRGSSRRNYGGGMFGGYWGNPFLIFFPSYDYRYDRPRSSRSQAPQEKPEGDRGFLENVFSFLFGDGNPNYDLDDHRYRLIANVIRNNEGVVVGEQVLPYLDEVSASAMESEDYMLAVLAKFNGYPEVSPQGGLVYRFPDLQMVASRRPRQRVADYLEEKLWQFNRAGDGANLLSAGLGIFYLGASLVLGYLLQNPVLVRNLSGFLGFIYGIFWFLLGYAVLFLAIPTVRYLLLQVWNEPLKRRNLLRQKWARQLQSPSPALRDKLQFAQGLAISQQVLDEQKIAYSTESDLLTQELEALLEGE